MGPAAIKTEVLRAAARVKHITYRVFVRTRAVLIKRLNPDPKVAGWREFFSAMLRNWFTAMSGPLSVPAAIASVYVENATQRTLLALTALLCVWGAGFTVWRLERRQMLDAKALAEGAQHAHTQAIEDQTRAIREQTQAQLSSLAKQPEQAGLMRAEALWCYLQTQVKPFAEIPAFDKRFHEVDVAVRDALSQGQLKASGRPKDWMMEMVTDHEARVPIDVEFWRKPYRRIDWFSLAAESLYERSAVTNNNGDIEFYDLAFESDAVARLWPQNVTKPISVTDVALLGELLGWNFKAGSHGLDFVSGLRSAASRGDLLIEGFDIDVKEDVTWANTPRPIPQAYWQDHWLDASPTFFVGTKNFDITTNTTTFDAQERYRDPHITDRAKAVAWLLTADEWRGRVAKGEALRAQKRAQRNRERSDEQEADTS